jgi:hypothetical protein
MCLPEGRFCSNFKIRTLNVGLRQLGNLQPLDFLAPRLHLAGAGSGGEARDEFVQLRDLLFALRVLPFDLRANLRLRDHHVVIRAGVSNDGLVIDVGDVSANAVEKMAIVRDHDQHALILIEKILQPVDRIEIEMVGRLVEQQRLRMPEQSLRQQHAHLLAARNLRHFALVHLVGNVEALQQNRGVASAV